MGVLSTEAEQRGHALGTTLSASACRLFPGRVGGVCRLRNHPLQWSQCERAQMKGSCMRVKAPVRLSSITAW